MKQESRYPLHVIRNTDKSLSPDYNIWYQNNRKMGFTRTGIHDPEKLPAYWEDFCQTHGIPEGTTGAAVPDLPVDDGNGGIDLIPGKDTPVKKHLKWKTLRLPARKN